MIMEVPLAGHATLYSSINAWIYSERQVRGHPQTQVSAMYPLPRLTPPYMTTVPVAAS